jgi:sugar phosphate isomerase/epimerase
LYRNDNRPKPNLSTERCHRWRFFCLQKAKFGTSEDSTYFPLCFDRKMTLKPLAILVAIILVWSRPLAGQEIGLKLESFSNELSTDAPAAMKKVHDLGFSQVEIGETYGLSFPQFIKLLATNGLTVVSFETTYERLTQSPNEVIDQARSYGAKFIVCSAGQSRVATPLGAEKTAEVLNQAGKMVAQNGLLLCYRSDPEDFSSVGNSTYFAHLLQHLQLGVVYLAMDVYAVKEGGQEPVALLRQHPTRFILMYLKDRKEGKRGADTTVTLGTGDVGIQQIMRTARELGIQHFFLNDNSVDAEQHISAGLAYLRTIHDQTRK